VSYSIPISPNLTSLIFIFIALIAAIEIYRSPIELLNQLIIVILLFAKYYATNPDLREEILN